MQACSFAFAQMFRQERRPPVPRRAKQVIPASWRSSTPNRATEEPTKPEADVHFPARLLVAGVWRLCLAAAPVASGLMFDPSDSSC